eukprot:TRINITY_DN23225_c0_g1_i1.p1 TRINITY_DN23225_c0_g1~~TRINITY_DN23225_c0_g1_i1.p1  ORF type:complete len:311 (+),score=43.40 TRINITY_DN23225_c0_g1_i1:57-935(+)
MTDIVIRNSHEGVISTWRRRPIASVGLGIGLSVWVVGIILFFFGTGFVTPPETLDQYTSGLEALADGRLEKAEAHAESECSLYQNSRGWFWSCSENCPAYRKRCEHATAAADAARQSRLHGEQMVRKQLGITVWSDVAVGEARSLWWERFREARRVAMDMTVFDVLFMAHGDNDGGIIGIILQAMARWFANMVATCCVAVVRFAFFLWSLATTFEASAMERVAFTTLASTAAASFLLLACVGCLGITGGAVVGTAAITTRIADRDDRGRALPFRDDHHRAAASARETRLKTE